jgi:hypothetical protein
MDDIPFEKVSVEEAIAALKKHTFTIAERNWRPEREASPSVDFALTGAVFKWLAQLPAAVRPSSLTQRYPRIANEIAEAWKSPAMCEKLLDKLLLDQRGSRKGFPLDVAQELITLKTHFHTYVSPQRVGIWGERIGTPNARRGDE